MKNDLISVIVPVYKVEKYLPKCIESIINQTYKNLEIILVDDGSPDNCGKICDEYAAKDKRIKVIHKENSGVSDSRNKGIAVANGVYLAFVDSDDYIDKEMFNKLYKRIIADGSDIALCNMLYVDGDGNSIDEYNHDMPITDCCITRKEAFHKLLEKKCWYYVPPWNKIYKKSIFDHILFPVGKRYEDEMVVYRLFDKCALISCVNEPLYYYLQHSESFMNSGYSCKNLDAVEAFIDRANFMVNIGEYYIAKVSINAALSKFFEGKRNLDMTIPENKKRFEELEQQFIELYSNIKKSPISIQAKILLAIFLLNQSMCQRIFEIKGK